MVRTGGLIGNTAVSWKIVDDHDSDFLYHTGHVEIADGEFQGVINISVRPDEIPELDEVFHVQITNVSQVLTVVSFYRHFDDGAMTIAFGAFLEVITVASFILLNFGFVS